MQVDANGWPRRNQTLKWVAAEHAIQRAVDEVERMGAHVLLTDAVILLAKARDKVADFVELPVSAPQQSPPERAPDRERETLLAMIEAAIKQASELGADAFDAIEGRGLYQQRLAIANALSAPSPAGPAGGGEPDESRIVTALRAAVNAHENGVGSEDDDRLVMDGSWYLNAYEALREYDARSSAPAPVRAAGDEETALREASDVLRIAQRRLVHEIDCAREFDREAACDCSHLKVLAFLSRLARSTPHAAARGETEGCPRCGMAEDEHNTGDCR